MTSQTTRTTIQEILILVKDANRMGGNFSIPDPMKRRPLILLDHNQKAATKKFHTLKDAKEFLQSYCVNKIAELNAK